MVDKNVNIRINLDKKGHFIFISGETQIEEILNGRCKTLHIKKQFSAKHKFYA